MPDRFFLEVVEGGEGAGQRIPLSSARTTIGRKAGNTLVLTDARVSGVHAEVVQEGGHWVLRDLGSTNGTFLEGRRVEEVTLSPGDAFALGGTVLRLLDAEAPALEGAKRLAPPAGARRSVVLPLALLLVVLAAAYAFFEFGGRSAGAGERPVAAVPGNLLRFPSFEPGAEEDPRSAWKLEKEGSASFTIGSEARRSGQSGAAISFEGACVARLLHEPEIPAEEGRSYLLAAHLRGEGVGLALRVAFHSARNPEFPWIRGGDFAEAASEDRRIEAKVVAPPGADRARFFLVAVGSAGRAFIDDVEMRAGEAARVPRLALDEVECLFDPLDTSVRRIREPWVRGLGVAFSSGGRRVEAASALSPSTGAVRLPEGPAGRLVCSAEAAVSGFQVRYALEGSGPVRPSLTLSIHPDYLAQHELTLLGPSGAPEYAGDFQEDAVTALVLGEGTGRMKVGFDRPLAVTGTTRPDGFRIEAPFEGAATVTLQVSFEEESRRARDLVREARGSEEARRPAEAIAIYGRVLSEFPFDKECLAQARTERARLLQQGLDRVAEVEAKAAEANFFRIPGAFREARRLAKSIAGEYAGTEVGTRADRGLARIDEEARAVEERAAAREAARLARIAEELEKRGEKTLAGLVREALPGRGAPK